MAWALFDALNVEIARAYTEILLAERRKAEAVAVMDSLQRSRIRHELLPDLLPETSGTTPEESTGWDPNGESDSAGYPQHEPSDSLGWTESAPEESQPTDSCGAQHNEIPGTREADSIELTETLPHQTPFPGADSAPESESLTNLP